MTTPTPDSPQEPKFSPRPRTPVQGFETAATTTNSGPTKSISPEASLSASTTTMTSQGTAQT